MKKTLTVYGMLFLFAFTFGLSFTLHSEVRAEDPGPGTNCCVYEWCYYYNPPTVGAWGHWWRPDPHSLYQCVNFGQDSCDVVYECPEN